ncbi:hypothetical protein HanHA89_Chr04g0128511 [Helianthus annuus]|nr:hypothetical protein HanHA89_Chr04g0128511 [Helianthus annuus]
MALFITCKISWGTLFLTFCSLIFSFMLYMQSSNSLCASTFFLNSWSSSLYFLASFTIFSISSLESRPFSLDIISFSILPVDIIEAETVRIPLASISKHSVTLETPLGAGGIPEILNLPSKWLSVDLDLSPWYTLILTADWLSKVV